MSRICEFIEAEYQAQGINLYDLAQKSGYSVIAIQSFLNGNKYTSFQMVEDLLAVLGYRLNIEKMEAEK